MNTKDFKTVDQIFKDIQNLNIQGATNVGIATLEGMKLAIEESKEKEPEKLFDEVIKAGNKLANARENEPLAKNGVTFVKHFFKKQYPVLPELATMKRTVEELCDEYLELISNAKKQIVEKGAPFLKNYDKILTHCHSSTAVKLIIELSKGDKQFEAVCTETRPRYQGRITAKNLLEAGIETTLIADSAAESFVIGRGSVSTEVVFIGCDQLTKDGYCINKIGSWGIGMASHYADKPLYVVTPLLKIDSESFHKGIEIEIREEGELWAEAPKGLNLFNPAFEIVDNTLITGFVTEFGIVEPKDLEMVIENQYPWLKID